MNKVSVSSKAWSTSPGQRRLWVLDQMLDGDSGAAYNMPVVLRLSGRLDVEVLGRAFHDVVARHEALRTTFPSVDEEPRQVVHAEPLSELGRVDLSGETDPEGAARELAARHAAARFDLANGPLVKATVVRLAEERHLLLFNIHHIVCDEWSLGVLVEELSALYGSAISGMPNPLPPLPVQYKDYAAWHIQRLDGEDMRRHRQYWQTKLAGGTASIPVPADRIRPTVKSYAAGAVTLQLCERDVADLKRLVAARHTTLFAALVALVKVLLFRYTNHANVTVGCAVAGRDHPDLHGQIGFYVNTLTLRDILQPRDTFEGVLDRVWSTFTEALEHKDYPFDALVSEMGFERDVSRSPVFDVSVNLTPSHAHSTGLRFPGVTISSYDLSFAMAKVDLSFDFTETAGGVQLTVIYSSALYDEHRIRNLTRHFQRLMGAAVAEPDRPIGLLPLLPETERRQLMTFAGADHDFPRDQTIVDLFEAQAERTPDQPALRMDGDTLTYDELNRRANQLARHLQSRGVGPEVPVGVFMERTPAMITALLGILKSGAAYLPLDTALPQARVTAMLNDSMTPIVITDAASEDKLPFFIGASLCLDAEWSEISLEPAENPGAQAQPDATAYLIYTSGSTGTPKAVALEHRGLRNVADVQRRLFEVGPQDHVLQFAAPSFDASVFDVVMALCWGATLHLGSRDALMPGPTLARVLSEERISIMTLPPSALAAMTPQEFPALRIVNVAGEACSPELPPIWCEGRRFFNLYGPSEATIWSTETSLPAVLAAGSIGRPISNVKVYLVDPRLQLVPIGVPGEVCIGGVGVARGYTNRPALTAEKFVPDPFNADAGSRMFRSGDIGRWQEDGTLEFMGRADHQVKVRGYRVELGEIETVLAQHPQVRSAVVVQRPDNSGEARLVGYVLPGTNEAVDVQDVRRWLRTRLPDYMIPAVIASLTTFPTMPSGKVDRSALQDPEATAATPVSTFVAPRTALESVLTGVFADVLGRERVSVTDNFFDIGGHSLLATRVVLRLRELFRVDFPLPRLFQDSSVTRLADALKALAPTDLEKVARALQRLWSMSDEEKRELRARTVGDEHDKG
jgi:amino acid adenylation domain-containing protein